MSAGRPASTSRSKILKAAHRILRKEGIAGLSVRNVAAAVDTAPSTIYNYFGSKQGFMAALANELLLAARPDIDAEKDPLDAVREWMRQHRRLLLKTPELIVLAHASGVVAGVYEISHDLYQLLQRAGLSEKDAVLHGRSLHYITNGFALQEITQKSHGVDPLADAPEEYRRQVKIAAGFGYDQLFESTIDRNLEGLKVYIGNTAEKGARKAGASK